MVRNELGEVVLLFFKLLKCASALEADMKAILWATKAVKNEEGLNVLWSSDAKSIIKKCGNKARELGDQIMKLSNQGKELMF